MISISGRNPAVWKEVSINPEEVGWDPTGKAGRGFRHSCIPKSIFWREQGLGHAPRVLGRGKKFP